MVLKFDARGERNLIGGFIVVVIALAGFQFLTGGPLVWIPICLFIVAFLRTQKVEVDLDARKIRTKQGYLLFARWQERSFTTPKALAVGINRTPYGPMYDVRFLYDDTGSATLLSLGYERTLKRLIKLAQPTRIPLEASPELAERAPGWLKEALGQR